MRRTQSRQSGVALIEAMVGILIFAFGVLGLVGLQASMTKAQTGAKFRAEASNLGNELVGLMWADTPANLPQYATAQCAGHARCADWSRKLAATLPSSSSVVTVNAATGDVTINITWTQPGEGQHQFNTSAVVIQ